MDHLRAPALSAIKACQEACQPARRHRPRPPAPALLGAGLVAVTLLAGCGASGGSSSAARSSAPAMPSSPGSAAGGTLMVAGQLANDHGRMSAVGKRDVNVELDDFYFSPTVLTGSPGQQLTLHLSNEGKAPHTFTLAGQHLDTVLQPGKDATVTVTFPTAGTTVFVCRFHEANNMRGALQVSGSSSSAAPGQGTSPTSSGSGGGGY